MTLRTMQRFTSILLLLLLTMTAVGARVDQTRGVQQAVVTITDSSFSPQEVTVIVGATVLWMNTGVIAHTSTSSTGLWDSGSIQPGGSYQSPAFNKVGVFNYHSSLDMQMTGKVIVVSSSASILYSGSVDGGLLAGYIIALMFAVVVVFWLNYPSAQSRAKARLR